MIKKYTHKTTQEYMMSRIEVCKKVTNSILMIPKLT